MKVKSRDVKKSGEKRKQEEDYVSLERKRRRRWRWALAGEDSEKLQAEPLASALSVWGHLGWTSGHFRKVTAQFGAAPMENASQKTKAEGRQTNRRAPLPVLAKPA